MPTTRLVLIALAIMLVPAAGASAQTPATDSVAVVRVVNQFHERMLAADTAGAAALLAPELVVMEGGAIERRADYLAHHLPADIEATRAAPSQRTLVHLTATTEMAVVASSSRTTREVRGQPMESTGAELMVLRRTVEGWRISAIHWSSRSRRPAAGSQ
ncbi:MAG: DUF4440 domain-containing protein [Gemmatimonadota bacterium]